MSARGIAQFRLTIKIDPKTTLGGPSQKLKLNSSGVESGRRTKAT
jgi:hypothetical protein